MGSVLKNRGAKELLSREFPELTSPLMLMMAKGMTLEAVLKLGEGRYPPEKLSDILEKLKAL